MRLLPVALLSMIAAAAGCGTTRWSDTARTATEQLIISTAVDRAIDNIDFRPLSAKYVYLDPQYLDCVDKNYVVSTLRQHMLAEGCILTADAASADYVVEARSGAVGTEHHDVLVGIPAISVPGASMAGIPSAIPEIPFAKTTAQKGIAKIACFAYNRETGQAVWQSGVFPVVATAKDSWFLGTGPFQRGTIYDGTRFAGSHFLFMRKAKTTPVRTPDVPIMAQAVFPERPALIRKKSPTTASAPPPKSASTAPGTAPPPVSGTAGPSLSSSAAAGAAPGQPAAPGATAGTSTGLPAGQVVRLPSISSTPSSGGSAGGLSLNPGSLLHLK